MIVALVGDLMDQSRIRAALPDVRFVRDPAQAADADVVLVDIARGADRVAAVRAVTPGRIVAFGPHVDDEARDAARSAGADAVLARSVFFRDPAAAAGT
ncbi:MAG: hypothetical protein ACKOVH_02820 [Actinomycetota bacterium]|nr:hypothetical protein [Actinomycetota bacterium]